MNCKIFHMNNRQDMYDCMFLKPLVGLEHLFQKWDLKHSQMRKYGRRVGRAGGRDGTQLLAPWIKPC